MYQQYILMQYIYIYIYLLNQLFFMYHLHVVNLSTCLGFFTWYQNLKNILLKTQIAALNHLDEGNNNLLRMK